MIDFDKFDELNRKLVEIKEYLHIEDSLERIAELEEISSNPEFWNDQEKAKVVMAQISSLKNDVDIFTRASEALADAHVAFDLSQDSDDAELYSESEHLIAEVDKQLRELELATWFSDDLDSGDAIVTVTPGLGGLEAQDWCDMLFKMYMRYAERRGWSVDVFDAPRAEAIGIDRAVFQVKGHNAYGMLRAEQGVHRLVRISPTDDKKRRQTTFAGVEVLPVVPDDIEIEIDPKDLRIDVYHASGPGGQGVNTTDSAVRITHIPTNIVVTCQNERSQLQNKAMCMRILKSKLYEIEQEKRNKELDELRGPKHDISFGNQIRSYVLYPYQLIKDLRTGYETGKVEKVLQDGDLDDFIIAYHRWSCSDSK